MALASGTDQLIHHCFIKHAAFAVEDHDLRLESVGLNLGLEMLDDMIHDGADTFGILHQNGHLRSTLCEIVPVLLTQCASDLLVSFVDGSLVDL